MWHDRARVHVRPDPTTDASPSAERAVRLACLGFQGFGNVGDEAILSGLERLLEGCAEISLVFGGPARIAAAPSAGRARPWRLLPTPQSVRGLMRVDALVLSGGGLMNDFWPFVILRYLLWCLAARVVGTPVVWVGAGVGPIRRRAWRIAAGAAFRMSRLVTVRDELSADWVRVVAPSVTPVELPDPAWFNERPASPEHPNGTAIVARSPAPGTERYTRMLADILTGVALTLRARGERVEFVFLHPDEDMPFEQLLREVLGPLRAAEFRFVNCEPVPSAAMQVLATFDRLLTMRLHGLILGALVGVPGVAIAYDEKVSQAAIQLGLDDLLLRLDELTEPLILERLDEASSQARRDRLESFVQRLRGRREEVKALLCESLRNDDGA